MSGPDVAEDTIEELEQQVERLAAAQELLAELKPKQSEMPFGLVYGKAITKLPDDLYIPPDALEVFLEAFEGPLDLLLYLIKRQNLDIDRKSTRLNSSHVRISYAVFCLKKKKKKKKK